jgi:cob(I)alamin adenosyltransferase
MEVIGTIDEVNTFIGLARSHIQSTEFAAILLSIQQDLYRIMAEVAADEHNVDKFLSIDHPAITALEKTIADLSDRVEIPKKFIVPGDTQECAFLDICRAIVRRAERRVVQLNQRGDLSNPLIQVYFNRLSSLFYVLILNQLQKSVQTPTFAKRKDAN